MIRAEQTRAAVRCHLAAVGNDVPQSPRMRLASESQTELILPRSSPAGTSVGGFESPSRVGAELTNASVRERFGLGEKDHTLASRLIRDAVLAKRIKPADPSSRSRKCARYLPFWVWGPTVLTYFHDAGARGREGGDGLPKSAWENGLRQHGASSAHFHDADLWGWRGAVSGSAPWTWAREVRRPQASRSAWTVSPRGLPGSTGSGWCTLHNARTTSETTRAHGSARRAAES